MRLYPFKNTWQDPIFAKSTLDETMSHNANRFAVTENAIQFVSKFTKNRHDNQLGFNFY